VTGIERGDQAQDFAPVLLHDIGPHLSTHERRQAGIGRWGADRDEPAIWKIAQPWAEPEAKQRAEREDVVGRAAR
jgi:hypothetical protein